MKKIGIMTDSHSGIPREEADRLGIRVLPMPFYMEGETYYEGVDISSEEFYEKLRSGVNVSTSQQSPQQIMDMWDEMLKEYEKVLYIPLSSGLSGACMTAQAMAREDEYEGKILVVDSGRVATPLHRIILDALELIEEGCTAEEIQKILEESKTDMSIYIALNTLENLKKGGRINPAVAVVGEVLNIKPVMQLTTGKLDIYQKCRGLKKAKHIMIEALKHDVDTRFKDAYDKGELYLMAASGCTAEETESWVKQIEEAFPGMKVMCDQLSFGISCHVGPGGLGIGCEVDKKRYR